MLMYEDSDDDDDLDNSIQNYDDEDDDRLIRNSQQTQSEKSLDLIDFEDNLDRIVQL